MSRLWFLGIWFDSRPMPMGWTFDDYQGWIRRHSDDKWGLQIWRFCFFVPNGICQL